MGMGPAAAAELRELRGTDGGTGTGPGAAGGGRDGGERGWGAGSGRGCGLRGASGPRAAGKSHPQPQGERGPTGGC